MAELVERRPTFTTAPATHSTALGDVYDLPMVPLCEFAKLIFSCLLRCRDSEIDAWAKVLCNNQSRRSTKGNGTPAS